MGRCGQMWGNSPDRKWKLDAITNRNVTFYFSLVGVSSSAILTGSFSCTVSALHSTQQLNEPWPNCFSRKLEYKFVLLGTPWMHPTLQILSCPSRNSCISRFCKLSLLASTRASYTRGPAVHRPPLASMRGSASCAVPGLPPGVVGHAGAQR